MNWQIVKTLVAKDLNLYFRNRFFAFITILGLVFYTLIYFVLPADVDETLEIAFFAPTLPPQFTEGVAEEGIELYTVETEAELKTAVTEGDYPVGVVLPEDMVAQMATGQKPRVDIYFTADFPPEFRDLYVIFLQELSFNMSGSPLNIEANEAVLGPDMAGEQIPLRNRMLPLFAVVILIMETMGLGSLISSEVEAGTLRALLITPTRVEGLFLSKGITGVLLAFVQVALVMGLTGGFQQEPVIILLALLLGSLLVTGIAFMVASVGRDMMSVMGWGVLALIILIIPTFNVLLPGTVSGWIRAIPSFYLVDTVHQVMNFGAGWPEVSANLVILAGFAAVFLALGVLALRRKFR